MQKPDNNWSEVVVATAVFVGIIWLFGRALGCW